MGVSLPDRTLIKQPVNQTLRTEPGVLQITERWKGRYTWCRDVLASLFSEYRVDYGTFRQNAGTLSAHYEAVPESHTGYDFVLANGTVDEIDAGENGILQLIWNAELSSSDPEDWPVQETWGIEWQPENYDVYSYCAEPKDHVDVGQTPLKSQRAAIEQCLHPPLGNTIQTTQMLFSENNGMMKSLNENEQKILKWKMAGKKPIKHHPVITQTKQWQHIRKSQIQQMITATQSEVKRPDLEDTPDEVFGLDGLYRWVSQGSSLHTIQPDVNKNDYTLQLQTRWVGADKFVPEFYSANDNERWEFGEE